MSVSNKTAGQLCYIGYIKSKPLNFRGDPSPSWDVLDLETRIAWEDAAGFLINKLGKAND